MINTEIRKGIHLPEEAFALQACRIISGELRTYTAICAPGGHNSFKWAKSAMNRIAICGIGDDYEKDFCLIDYLDEDGDIIDSVDISKSAFDYARRQWKFKRLA